MTALPIVVLPGMDGTGLLFRPFVDCMARHRKVLVGDYPRDTRDGYSGLLRLVTEVHAPDEPYLLLAESFSGPLAIDLASRDPRIAGLILVSTFARNPLPAWLERPSRFVDVRRLPRWLIEALLLGSDNTPRIRDDLARVLPTISKEAMRARTSAALTVDMRGALKKVLCPILCIAGRRDLLLGARGLRGIKDTRPDTDVVLIDGPHMLLETRPEPVASAIERWLAQNASRAPPVTRNA